MRNLKFSYNWNRKLDCNAFTTLRLARPGYYAEGQDYYVKLKEQDRGLATLQRIKTLRLAQLNDFIAYLDTGYGLDQTIDIIKKMYKNQNINWETQELYLMLFVRVIPSRPEPNFKEPEVEE